MMSAARTIRKRKSEATLLGSAVQVPRLKLRCWDHDVQRKHVVNYIEDDHAHHPHVVKFSGGRSSGLMLLTLLKNGILSPERGDVVLFTNTAAEHPVTYDFVRKMKAVSESAGIPFFIAEFMTIETVVNGMWKRRPTYRLVKCEPYDRKTSDDGYRWKGEVFNEAITWSAMLPTVYTRICTTQMKMLVTRLFLADYWGCLNETQRLGHFSNGSLVDVMQLFNEHRRNGGTMSREEFIQRWAGFRKSATSRSGQRFVDFSESSQTYKSLTATKTKPIRCSLFGEQAVKFITFLGFRAGEDERYRRMMDRNTGVETPGHANHPPGEFSLAPLYELGINQNKVLQFWRKQPPKLRPYLPEHINLSNCVYCFLKGPKNLAELNIKKRQFEATLPTHIKKTCNRYGSANKIEWWIRLENNKGRSSRNKDVDGRGRFGMFGLNNFGYEDIKKAAAKLDLPEEKNAAVELPDAGMACECTD